MATKRGTVKKGTTKKKSQKRPSKSKEREVDLDFVLPSDLPLHYVDNIQVIHTPTEFVISFMQAKPPLLTSEKAWDKVQSIESKCVARIVVHPVKMQLMVQALVTNLRKFIQSYIPQEQVSENENTKTNNGTNGRKLVQS